jgi:hypothetical protein
VAPAPKKKKKKGIFGKVKGLAKNKIVKTVGKAALCTVVPGGQVIAGALDAAENKDVAGAAATAVTGGGSCMPGMAGMAPNPAAAAGGLGGLGAGALGAGVPGAGLPGQPSMGMPGMAMSPEQLRQMQEQYSRMGMDTAQIRAMMSSMQGAPPVTAAPAGAAPAGPQAHPASGSPALSREKGKILVRGLPWLAGSEAVRTGGDPMFGMAMQEVASEMKATGKRYKIEARVEEQGGKAQNHLLAQKRAAAIVRALSARGVSPDRLAISKGKSDKDPRIIASEGK